MKTSYIINTACLDPLADGGNPHRSAKYRERHTLLTQRVLPAALEQGFDEIIVAGSFESGAGYRYIRVDPRCRDRRDALYQREAGARHATGDILVFGHDDHRLADNFCATLHTCGVDGWDLLVPKRIHGITGATLNNGFEDAPGGQSYMGGHVLVMKRWLWAEVPWTACDTEFWDTSMTRLWQEAGAKIVFSTDLIHMDVEAGPNES